jgi:hypothetical protein
VIASGGSRAMSGTPVARASGESEVGAQRVEPVAIDLR